MEAQTFGLHCVEFHGVTQSTNHTAAVESMKTRQEKSLKRPESLGRNDLMRSEENGGKVPGHGQFFATMLISLLFILCCPWFGGTAVSFLAEFLVGWPFWPRTVHDACCEVLCIPCHASSVSAPHRSSSWTLQFAESACYLLGAGCFILSVVLLCQRARYHCVWYCWEWECMGEVSLFGRFHLGGVNMPAAVHWETIIIFCCRCIWVLHKEGALWARVQETF